MARYILLFALSGTPLDYDPPFLGRLQADFLRCCMHSSPINTRAVLPITRSAGMNSWSTLPEIQPSPLRKEIGRKCCRDEHI